MFIAHNGYELYKNTATDSPGKFLTPYATNKILFVTCALAEVVMRLTDEDFLQVGMRLTDEDFLQVGMRLTV